MVMGTIGKSPEQASKKTWVERRLEEELTFIRLVATYSMESFQIWLQPTLGSCSGPCYIYAQKRSLSSMRLKESKSSNDDHVPIDLFLRLTPDHNPLGKILFMIQPYKRKPNNGLEFRVHSSVYFYGGPYHHHFRGNPVNQQTLQPSLQQNPIHSTDRNPQHLITRVNQPINKMSASISSASQQASAPLSSKSLFTAIGKAGTRFDRFTVTNDTSSVVLGYNDDILWADSCSAPPTSTVRILSLIEDFLKAKFPGGRVRHYIITNITHPKTLELIARAAVYNQSAAPLFYTSAQAAPEAYSMIVNSTTSPFVLQAKTLGGGEISSIFINPTASILCFNLGQPRSRTTSQTSAAGNYYPPAAQQPQNVTSVAPAATPVPAVPAVAPHRRNGPVQHEHNSWCTKINGKLCCWA
ncbi:hypothetical protein B7494_g3221 [Chlorociboria aeruginascens]|nr:hypothetical protein B7494_g3221 [Chlorociboria aeruginascens]